MVGEEPAFGVDGGELVGVGVGVEAPQEHLGAGVGGELSGQGGGQGSVAGDQGGFVVVVEQGPVGHDQLDFDAGSIGGLAVVADAARDTHVVVLGRRGWIVRVAGLVTVALGEDPVAGQAEESGGVFVGHDLAAAAPDGVAAGGDGVGVSAQAGVGGDPGRGG